MTQAQRIIAETYMSGLHIREIAAKAGVTPGSAKVIASRLGLKRGMRTPKPKPFQKVTFCGKDKTEWKWGGY